MFRIEVIATGEVLMTCATSMAACIHRNELEKTHGENTLRIVEE